MTACPISCISAGRLPPALTMSKATVWRLCRMRHSRHYAASWTMPRGSRRSGPRPAGCKAACHWPFNMRHSPEGLGSELFEEGQQLVVRLKTLGSAFDWIGFGQGLFLHGKVGIEIDLGSFDRLMTKPKRNHLLVRMPGRLPDAIAEYQAALRVRPDYADGHYDLGVALSRLPNRLPEALFHLETALRLKPDPELRRAVERLRAASGQRPN